MIGPRLHALRGAGHRLLLLGKRRTGMFVHDGLQEGGSQPSTGCDHRVPSSKSSSAFGGAGYSRTGSPSALARRRSAPAPQGARECPRRKGQMSRRFRRRPRLDHLMEAAEPETAARKGNIKHGHAERQRLVLQPTAAMRRLSFLQIGRPG